METTFNVGDNVGFWVHSFKGVVKEVHEFEGVHLYQVEVPRAGMDPISFTVPASDLYRYTPRMSWDEYNDQVKYLQALLEVGQITNSQYFRDVDKLYRLMCEG